MNPVLILEYPIVSYGIRMFVNNFFPNSDIIHAYTLVEAERILANHAIHLVIMDIVTPISQDMEVINALRKVKPEIRILIFTDTGKSKYSTTYLDAGINGFLCKDSCKEEYKDVINKIFETC
jgi:DNA-binding NarL/FixJ family response regulator